VSATNGHTFVYQYADNFNGYSWSDGVPTGRAANTPTGVWMYGKGNGFELKFLADTTPRTLKLYVGAFGARGAFTATLGGSSLRYTDSSISNDKNGPGGVYTLDVVADTPGQLLDIKYVVEQTFDSTGNVTLQAATLSAPGANNPPAVAISSPTDGANFSANDNIEIAVEAADTDGTIAKVEFFQGDSKLGESTASPYSLTWSNAPAGTKSFVVVMDDYLARAGEGFAHWAIYNIPANITEIPSNAGATEGDIAGVGRQAYNDFLKRSYSGPCPPAGAPHVYRFTVFALDIPTIDDAGTPMTWRKLRLIIRGHILGQSSINALRGH